MQNQQLKDNENQNSAIPTGNDAPLRGRAELNADYYFKLDVPDADVFVKSMASGRDSHSWSCSARPLTGQSNGWAPTKRGAQRMATDCYRAAKSKWGAMKFKWIVVAD